MIGLQKQNYTSSLMAVGLGLLLGFSPVADATQKKGNACDVASTEVPVNWLPGAPSAYKGQIIVRDDKSALIVALSSNASLNFFKEPIRQTTIYMMDGYSSYYTRSAGKIVGAISLYAKTHGYRKIVFIGSSKGGFGALLFGESALADEFRALRHLPEVPALIEITIRGMNSPRSAENLDLRPAAPVTGVPHLLQRSP